MPPYATLHTKGHDVGVGVGKKRFDGGPPLNMTHVAAARLVGMMRGAAQGLEYTRFNKGFDRRNQAKIGQDAERKEHERLQAAKKVVTDRLRTDRLQEIKDYNGFDVISRAVMIRRRSATTIRARASLGPTVQGISRRPEKSRSAIRATTHAVHGGAHR